MKVDSESKVQVGILPLGLMGFLLAVLILVLGAERTIRSAEFIRSPYGLSWLVMNGMQGTLWFVSIPYVFRWYREAWKGWRSRPWSILSGVLLLCAVQLGSGQLFAATYHPKDLPLSGHLDRVGALTLIGGLVATAAIVRVWLAQVMLESVFTEGKSTFDRAERLIEVRRQSQRFLAIAGLVIGSATLSFGVLRSALMALEPSRRDFPPVLVIIWGIFYSINLALAYAPMLIALVEAEQRVVHEFIPTPSCSNQDPILWLTKRDELRKGLRQTGWLQLQPLLSILTPLMGSVLSILVGF